MAWAFYMIKIYHCQLTTADVTCSGRLTSEIPATPPISMPDLAFLSAYGIFLCFASAHTCEQLLRKRRGGDLSWGHGDNLTK